MFVQIYTIHGSIIHAQFKEPHTYLRRAVSGLPLTTAFRERVSDVYVRCRVSRAATVGARARKGIAHMSVMNASHAMRSRQNGKRGSATH